MNVNDFRPEDLDDELAAYNDAVEFAEILEASSLGGPDAVEARRAGANRLVADMTTASCDDSNRPEPTAQSLMRHVADHFDKSGRQDIASLWTLISFVRVTAQSARTNAVIPPYALSLQREDAPSSQHASTPCACGSRAVGCELDFGMRPERHVRPPVRFVQQNDVCADRGSDSPSDAACHDPDVQPTWSRTRGSGRHRKRTGDLPARSSPPTKSLLALVGMAVAAAGLAALVAGKTVNAHIPAISPAVQSSESGTSPSLRPELSASAVGAHPEIHYYSPIGHFPPLPGGTLVDSSSLTALTSSLQHAGIAILPKTGDGAVYAIEPGVIVDITENAEAGADAVAVAIEQTDGTRVIYGNLNERQVSVGEHVSALQRIGSASSALLFEVSDGTGADVDELAWLRERGIELPRS